jgi:cytochrome c6
MKKRIRTFTLLLAPLIAVPAIAFAATAHENWMEHCARCHGADGTGNTKIGKKLKLHDYSNPSVQARITDDEMYDAIAEGVYDDRKKERMKPYKDVLTQNEMKDLVALVRSFKK